MTYDAIYNTKFSVFEMSFTERSSQYCNIETKGENVKLQVEQSTIDQEVDFQRVMDRKKLAETIHAILSTGIDMLAKGKLETVDFGKIKIIRSISPALSAGVLMVQQETAQQRNLLIKERMKNLGYNMGDGEKRMIEQ